MRNVNWNKNQILELFKKPFFDLLYEAQTEHRKHFTYDDIELCVLQSIKTGGCCEDCAYCPQSKHYKVDLETESLMDVDAVLEKAKRAKKCGAKRFCMGAAWRTPPRKGFLQVLEMVKAVKNLGLETCVTLGMLNEIQAKELAEAGLDFYNHNLDTSPSYYKKIISTRKFEDRLRTLACVAKAGIHICCGGIIGMGETLEDRVDFLYQLTQLPEIPKSLPINRLVPIKGTPLENTPQIDDLDFIRTIAVARILFPTAYVRLSAGRESMTRLMQTLCFMAGANSFFIGDKLLTAPNSEVAEDEKLLEALAIGKAGSKAC